MGNPSSSELYVISTEAMSKYIYYLLAAAGAATAYSVEILNKSSAISWPILLLVVALVAWSASIYCGCKALLKEISTHNLTFEKEQIKEIIEQASRKLDECDIPEITQLFTETEKAQVSAINKFSADSSKFMHLQFKLALAGFIAFVLWRILGFIVSVGCP